MKLDADEKQLLESFDRGEWKSTGGGKRERVRYARYAKATFRKDRRLSAVRRSPEMPYRLWSKTSVRSAPLKHPTRYAVTRASHEGFAVIWRRSR